MGRVFHGPFRISDVVDAEAGKDGNFFVRFQDEKGNIVGAIFELGALRNIVSRLEAAVIGASVTSSSGDMARQTDKPFMVGK